MYLEGERRPGDSSLLPGRGLSNSDHSRSEW